MVEWVLIPAAKSLFAEFNSVAPRRSKASDGSIGDDAHSETSSDHNPDETGKTPYEDTDNLNEVHAIDVDKDLNAGTLTMEKCVQLIVARHATGLDDRLQNIIYNRRIWSRSWGWTERSYTTGSNPHIEHAHFGFRYTTAQENDTSPWGLEGLVEMTQDEFNRLMSTWANGPNMNGRSLTGTLNAIVEPGADSWMGRRVWEHAAGQAVATMVAEIKAAVGGDDLDEDTLAALVSAQVGAKVESLLSDRNTVVAVLRRAFTTEELAAIAGELLPPHPLP